MAIIRTNAVNSTWSSPGAWVGGVVPTAADDAVIVTGATISVDGPGATARTVKTEGTASLQIGAGYAGAHLTIPAGGSIELAPSSTLAINYYGQLILSGTAASPIVVFTTGGTPGAASNARIAGSGSGTGSLVASYTTFRNLQTGNTATTAGLQATPDNTAFVGSGFNEGQTWTCANCTFDATSIYLSGTSATTTFRIVNCQWVNLPASAVPLTLSGFTAMTGGQRLIDLTAFQGTPNLYPPVGLTVSRSYFPSNYGTTDGAWTSFTGSLCRKTTPVEWPAESDMDSCYFLNDFTTINPHGIMPSAARPVAITGSVFEYTGTDTTGDAVILPSPAVPTAYRVEGNVKLPNAAGTSSGTLTSMEGNGNVRLTVRRNTECFGGAGGERGGVRIGEPTNSFVGSLVEVRDNLFWGPSGAAGFKAYDIAPTKATDAATSASLHHNAGWNQAAGSNRKGYDGFLFSSGLPGANDVDLGTGADAAAGGPRFVDPTRNLARWGAARQGADGTVAGALAKIAADRTTIADLISWVRGGFAPQNPALHLTDSTGTGTIGALAYQAAIPAPLAPTPAPPPTPSPAPTPAPTPTPTPRKPRFFFMRRTR